MTDPLKTPEELSGLPSIMRIKDLKDSELLEDYEDKYDSSPNLIKGILTVVSFQIIYAVNLITFWILISVTLLYILAQAATNKHQVKKIYENEITQRGLE